MSLVVLHDIKTFKEKALPFLLKSEAEHCLLIGLIAMMEGPHQEKGSPLYRVVEDGGKVVGAAMRTGEDRALNLSNMPGAAAAELAKHFATQLTEVSGRADVVEAFLSGTQARAKPKLEMQLYKLERVIPPPPVSGALRLAAASDEPLVTSWAAQFIEDAKTGDEVGRACETAKVRLSNGHIYLWEDGIPVCHLMLTRPTPNGISISNVFTERRSRGRGYAANLVAQVSQRLLDEGKKFCFLFADLANPASNRIYRRIGYESVGHFRQVTLS